MSDWKKVIGTLAPTIATAFGGPMAGVATRFLAGAVLGDKNASEADLETAILSATPELLAKIKSIDNQFKVEMKKLDVDLERISANDRDSARGLAKINMWPQIVLSVFFVVGYFSLLVMLFDGDIKIDDSIRDVSNILLGVLSSGIPMILRFWFGGSQHDEAQMNRIHNSVPK